MAPSGITVNKQLAIGIIVVVTGAIILYRWHWLSAPSSAEQTEFKEIKTAVTDMLNQKEIDVTKLPEVPLSKPEDLRTVAVEKITITVHVKGKALSIYSLQTTPRSVSAHRAMVLLLHGQGDNSHNWEQVNTLQLLALWGFRAVAVDLPGHGESSDAELGPVSREDFMLALVNTLDTRPVIVAPSMAGSFALPYLFTDPATSTQRAAAFVPVSPVGTDEFVHSYPDSKIQTLILYGAEDRRLGTHSREKLQALPNSHIVAIPQAGHASFKDQPDLFHRALYHFLNTIRL